MPRQSSPPSRPSRSTPPPPKGPSRAMLIGAIAVVLVGVGLLVFWRGRSTSDAASTADAAELAKKKSITDVNPTPEAEAAAAAAAAIGPHKQSDLPPIPFPAYAPP